ncbi:hypothetical protein [Streptomyces sp. NPDC046939]
MPNGDVRLAPRGWPPNTTDEVWAGRPDFAYTEGVGKGVSPLPQA